MLNETKISLIISKLRENLMIRKDSTEKTAFQMCQRNNNIFNNKKVINIYKLTFIVSLVIKMMIFTNFAIFITDEKINVNFKIFITSLLLKILIFH